METTRERVGLSLNEAFQIIDTWKLGNLGTVRTSSNGDDVSFDFDEVRINLYVKAGINPMIANHYIESYKKL